MKNSKFFKYKVGDILLVEKGDEQYVGFFKCMIIDGNGLFLEVGRIRHGLSENEEMVGEVGNNSLFLVDDISNIKKLYADGLRENGRNDFGTENTVDETKRLENRKNKMLGIVEQKEELPIQQYITDKIQSIIIELNKADESGVNKERWGYIGIALSKLRGLDAKLKDSYNSPSDKEKFAYIRNVNDELLRIVEVDDYGCIKGVIKLLQGKIAEPKQDGIFQTQGNI